MSFQVIIIHFFNKFSLAFKIFKNFFSKERNLKDFNNEIKNNSQRIFF
jgi:hypothetical protein